MVYSKSKDYQLDIILDELEVLFSAKDAAV